MSDNETVRRVMRDMGRKGGKARMAKLTPEERMALSRKASRARTRQAKKLRRKRILSTPVYQGKV